MPRKARPPSQETVEKLQALLERSRRAESIRTTTADELAVATFRACTEEGASRDQIAKALGVGKSTVQGWVNRGRQIVGQDGG